MLKISDLMSKPVLSLYEAKKEGVIRNIIFDSKLKFAKAVQLLCEDDNEPDEKYINIKDVYRFGKDVAVIKNNLPVYYDWQAKGQMLSPVNADIYTPGGERIGKVCDIGLDENTFAVLEIYLENNASLGADEIAALSNNIIIKQDLSNPVKLSKAVKKVPKSDSRKVTIVRSPANQSASETQSPAASRFADANQSIGANRTSATSHTIGANQSAVSGDYRMTADAPFVVKAENYTYYKAIIENNSAKGVTLPERIAGENVEVSRSPQAVKNSGYGFLIGRKMTSDLYANDTLILKKGALIDSPAIEKAKDSGCVVQLAINSD